MTPKEIRAKQIEQIIICIAEQYKVDPVHIIDDVPRKARKVMSARRILVYQLYHCGMSYDMIARFLKRDLTTIRDYHADGKRIVLNGFRDFVDALPRVTTTLEISMK